MAQDLEPLVLPAPTGSALIRRQADLSHGELPAHLLRRILSLTGSVGQDTGLDIFAERLAQVACEMGGFPWALIFLLDTADEAFYAEAKHGLAPDDWPEVLAVTVPRRVYERVLTEAPPGDHLVEVRAGDVLLDDDEIAACFLPLLHLLDPSAASRAEHPPRGSVLLISLDVPGRGTIGFCACGRGAQAPPLRLVTRRALQALAAQGAIFTEHIHLYRQRMEEAAVSTALLQVANAVGTTDLDLLVKRTLAVLPRLFGGQIAALLYLDQRRGELRMLEPTPADCALTALTEVLLSPARLEQLDP